MWLAPHCPGQGGKKDSGKKIIEISQLCSEFLLIPENCLWISDKKMPEQDMCWGPSLNCLTYYLWRVSRSPNTLDSTFESFSHYTYPDLTLKISNITFKCLATRRKASNRQTAIIGYRVWQWQRQADKPLAVRVLHSPLSYLPSPPTPTPTPFFLKSVKSCSEQLINRKVK